MLDQFGNSQGHSAVDVCFIGAAGGGHAASGGAVTPPLSAIATPICNGDSDSKAVPYFAQKYWGEFDYKPIEVTTKHTNPPEL
jgi:hypothetical protein